MAKHLCICDICGQPFACADPRNNNCGNVGRHSKRLPEPPKKKKK